MITEDHRYEALGRGSYLSIGVQLRYHDLERVNMGCRLLV